MASPDGAGLDDLTALSERVLALVFAQSPATARGAGEHRLDGVLAPVGAACRPAQLSAIDALLGELRDLEIDAPDAAEARATLLTIRHRLEAARFTLVDRGGPSRLPDAAIAEAADVASYVSRAYAPAPDRAEALVRHLGELPGWLDAAREEFEDSFAPGPREIAVDSARGFAGYYREELAAALGPLPGDLPGRLRQAATEAAAACDRFADDLQRRPANDAAALGETQLLRMLSAQEGVDESVASLRDQADAELDRLRGAFDEVAGRLGAAGGLTGALAAMEADHPTAGGLLAATEATLEALRRFWEERDALTIPGGHSCLVRPTPAYRRWSTASFEPSGALEPDGLPHFYFVTTVQPDWTAEQGEQWLRHLNLASLENISVHEVYPGHFVHDLHARRQPNPLRRSLWTQGFGEGWAHYTEEMAVEQGLAEGRPLLHLAQLQDALLRACRMRGSIGLHAEDWSVEQVTELFVDAARLPRLPAEREAFRATHDPMYLLYTYGKLAIQRWRALRESQPGFSLRGFHDAMLDSGAPPLAAVEALILSAP
ncbi:MAG: DUF885 domain-containing protein [Candidatus Dormibacteria bacterium]